MKARMPFLDKNRMESVKHPPAESQNSPVFGRDVFRYNEYTLKTHKEVAL